SEPPFLFKAEDGIRCFHVTGVQTCALPIYRRGGPRARTGGRGSTGRATGVARRRGRAERAARGRARRDWTGTTWARTRRTTPQVDRKASCRERVPPSGVATSVTTEEPGTTR